MADELKLVHIRIILRFEQFAYQSQAARVLLRGSWAAVALGLLVLGLLVLGYSAGILLLFPVVTYWSLYYLGRADAELTERDQMPSYRSACRVVAGRSATQRVRLGRRGAG